MRVLSYGLVLVDNVGEAGSFFLRFIGWFNPFFRRKNGVLIYPCNAVHTIGMRRAIDVVFVDSARNVLRIEVGLRPQRFAFCRPASYVLELPLGMAGQYGFFEGQKVEFN